MQMKKWNVVTQGLRCLPLCIALGFAMGLSACKDDMREEPDKAEEKITESLVPTEDFIGKVDIALEADIEPMYDPSARSQLNFYIMDRSEKITEVDGNTIPTGVDYSSEYAPRMYFEQGATVQGLLIFLHDDGSANPTVFRKVVNFEIIEGVKKGSNNYDVKARNRIRYVGDVKFPVAHTLAKEYLDPATNFVPSPTRVPAPTKYSRWRVMAMIGYYDTKGVVEDKDGTGGENHMNIGRGLQITAAATPSIDWAQRATNTIDLNVPCISSWKPLYISRGGNKSGRVSYTGHNFTLDLRPQGVILQYDLSSLAYDAQDLRRVGVVSNTLDFRGYVDVNAAAVRAGYANRDDDNYGMPTWVPDEPSAEDLTMNYAPSSAAPLSSGARVYPWDMPTLSSSNAPGLQNWPSTGTNSWSIEDPAVSNFYPLGNVGRYVQQASAYPWLSISRFWGFIKMSGPSGNTSSVTSFNSERFVFYFWGMPRTASRLPASSKRATYMYVSSYSLMSDRDAYNGDDTPFDTETFVSMRKTVMDLYNQLGNMLNTGQINKATYDATIANYTTNSSANPYRSIFPGGLIGGFADAKELATRRVQDANNNYITPRTQPLMILHQTDRTFTPRKVHHAQIVIKPDLMLTEVIYQKQAGQNYSLLELTNPTMEPVDLSQYGIVRLIPSTSGDYLAYRNAQGQAVDDLTDALVLPLTALKGESDPFSGSGLSALRTSGYAYPDAQRRSRPVYYDRGWSYSRSRSAWNGRWSLSSLIDESTTHPDRSFYIYANQSILLGASGYVNSPVTISSGENASTGTFTTGYNRVVTTMVSSASSWFSTIHGQMSNSFSRCYLRYAAAYADGVKQADNSFAAGTLDYEPGDAFALVKRTSTGWQIIDATGPVGADHLAFAGSYTDFKSQFATVASATSFSQKRMDGVNYPFIAPFRTKKLTTNWADDWTLETSLSNASAGRRFNYSGWENPNVEWSVLLKRSPIDASFTNYQNARPTKNY